MRDTPPEDLGIPEKREWKDTADLRERATVATKQGQASDIVEVFEQLLSRANGRESPQPPIDVKKFRNGNWWIQAAIGTLIACSGAFAAYKATEARSVNNEESIEEHENLSSHPGSQRQIQTIRDQITSIDMRTGQMQEQQKIITDGIESLKEEAQTDKQVRLKEKVLRLEQENTRLERNR